MTALTVKEIFNELCEPLSLTWLAGQEGADRSIEREAPDDERPNLLGILSLISPNRIQVIGQTEYDGLARISHSIQQELFRQHCQLLIVADGIDPGEQLINLANDARTPLVISPQPCRQVMNTLGQFLNHRLSHSEVLHGVLMEVLGAGVLITGESSIGKSELALELISRGHSLVADDAPEFRRIAHNTIEGNCPPLLRDFLEVRGLGVLNIRRMYGHASTRHRKVLRFIVRLELMDDQYDEPRLSHLERTRSVLGVEIAEVTLPVAPGRNLAVLVEAAVRNYLLRKSGYDSAVEFETMQSQLLDN